MSVLGLHIDLRPTWEYSKAIIHAGGNIGVVYFFYFFFFRTSCWDTYIFMWLDGGMIFADVTVAVSCCILVFLFALQHIGTRRVSFLFAPIVLTWLFCNSSVGVYNVVVHNPKIFRAVSPYYMYNYFRVAGMDGWVSLGGILLCITGWSWCIFYHSLLKNFWLPTKNNPQQFPDLLKFSNSSSEVNCSWGCLCRSGGNVCRSGPFFSDIHQGYSFLH